MAKKRLRFAYLVLEEHPWGRAMLRQLLERGHRPGLIIQEVSAVGDEERQKFITRMAGQPLAPPIAEQVEGLKLRLEAVGNHNDLACLALLDEYRPELVVLGGTRILRKHLLEFPAPFINAHPGLLPWLRGSASVGWALYLNQPIGATVHFIDTGIDTGDIILRRELPVTRGDTYESLNYRVAELAGLLMAEVLDMFLHGEVPHEQQDSSVGQTYKVIPDDLLAQAKARLAEGQYGHYAETA